MAKISILKFNDGECWSHAVCKKTWFGRKYLSRNTGLWWADQKDVNCYCMTSKENAIRLYEEITGMKWSYGY